VAAIDYTLHTYGVFGTTISHHTPSSLSNILFYLFNFISFLYQLWMMAPWEERHRNGSNQLRDPKSQLGGTVGFIGLGHFKQVKYHIMLDRI
jgi:hypothetical protein